MLILVIKINFVVKEYFCFSDNGKQFSTRVRVSLYKDAVKLSDKLLDRVSFA